MGDKLLPEPAAYGFEGLCYANIEVRFVIRASFKGLRKELI